MGVTTLFFGQNKKTSFGFLTADVLKTETIDFNSEVTDHPVEFGFEISDHVILKPVGIKASFFISDSDIKNGSSANISRVAEAYEILKLQRALRFPFAYVSNLQIFPFAIATNISVPRSSADGDSLTFDLTIQEIEVIPPLGLLFPATSLPISSVATVASMVVL